MAQECATLIEAGAVCGILAVGRCSECGRPFCPSHQARGNPLVPDPARCNACYIAAVAAAEALRRTQATEESEARQQVPTMITAITSSPSAIWIPRRRKALRSKETLGSRLAPPLSVRKYKQIPFVEDLGDVVAIGKLRWEFDLGYHESERETCESGVTRQEELVVMSGRCGTVVSPPTEIVRALAAAMERLRTG